jgi:hypothetical protein
MPDFPSAYEICLFSCAGISSEFLDDVEFADLMGNVPEHRTQRLRIKV